MRATLRQLQLQVALLRKVADLKTKRTEEVTTEADTATRDATAFLIARRATFA